LAILCCTAALILPFASTFGLTSSSSFQIPKEVLAIPVSSLVIGFVWIISVLVGATRRHESTIWCVIDSLGIPGSLAAIFYALK
jgi:hypothetical protein